MSASNGEPDAHSAGETTRLLANGNPTEQDVSETKSTVKIGSWRAGCIMLNLSVLIFLQCWYSPSEQLFARVGQGN
jgi:hypothetical protein